MRAGGRGATPYIGRRRGPRRQDPDVVAHDIRTWPHWPVLPTVGGSPNAVAHNGGNSKRRGPRRQMYISPKFWYDQLFFENHDKLNIKKNSSNMSSLDLHETASRLSAPHSPADKKNSSNPIENHRRRLRSSEKNREIHIHPRPRPTSRQPRTAPCRSPDACSHQFTAVAAPGAHQRPRVRPRRAPHPRARTHAQNVCAPDPNKPQPHTIIFLSPRPRD
jgi:hypothetical protein